jgi:hypothetical protein
MAGRLAGVEPRVQVSFVTLLAAAGVSVALLLVLITKGRLGAPQPRTSGS